MARTAAITGPIDVPPFARGNAVGSRSKIRGYEEHRTRVGLPKTVVVCPDSSDVCGHHHDERSLRWNDFDVDGVGQIRVRGVAALVPWIRVVERIPFLVGTRDSCRLSPPVFVGGPGN